MTSGERDETMSHTPGPWIAGGRFKGQIDGIAAGTGKHFLFVVPGTDRAAYDVRARIVACVNACEGISPEAVPEMLHTLDIQEQDIEELLEALRGIQLALAAWLGSEVGAEGRLEEAKYNIVDAAIAAATGEDTDR